MRRERRAREIRQQAVRANQAAKSGMGLPLKSPGSIGSPNRRVHTVVMVGHRVIRKPHQVFWVALSTWAKPQGTSRRMSSEMRATGFHFTQADTARESRERTTIQIQLPTKIAKAIPRLFAIQEPPSR